MIADDESGWLMFAGDDRERLERLLDIAARLQPYAACDTCGSDFTQADEHQDCTEVSDLAARIRKDGNL